MHPVEHLNFYNSLKQLVQARLAHFNRTLTDFKASGYYNQRFRLAELGREPITVQEPGPFGPPDQSACAQWLDRWGRYQGFIFVDLQYGFWIIGLQVILQIRDFNISIEQSVHEGEVLAC